MGDRRLWGISGAAPCDSLVPSLLEARGLLAAADSILKAPRSAARLSSAWRRLLAQLFDAARHGSSASAQSLFGARLKDYASASWGDPVTRGRRLWWVARVAVVRFRCSFEVLDWSSMPASSGAPFAAANAPRQKSISKSARASARIRR